MRLLLCANNDFISNYALNLLWRHIRHHEASIVLSQSIGAPSAPKAAVFAHMGAFERDWVNKQKVSSGFCTFQQLAESMNGAIMPFANINQLQALDQVRAYAPDAIISIRYGHIFKPPLFDIPRYGVLNLHGGLLPAYRGIYATFWAMLHQKKDIGCTLHFVRDAGIDTGAIIEEHRQPADYTRSVMWNTAMLYDAGTQMIARALAVVERGNMPAEMPQVSEGAGYYSYPLDADVNHFEGQGGKLFEERDYRKLFAA